MNNTNLAGTARLHAPGTRAFAYQISVLLALVILLSMAAGNAVAGPEAGKNSPKGSEGCWNVAGTPAGNYFLNSVEVLSSNDVWAVGSYSDGSTVRSAAMHWDGSVWSNVPVPEVVGLDYLYDVSAVASNDVWAVGMHYSSTWEEQQWILHWDGSTWTISVALGAGRLVGVAAVAANDVWAVGSYNSGAGVKVRVLRWNGSDWISSGAPSPSAQWNILYDVVAVSSGEVWAVGEYGDSSNTRNLTLVLRWNGTEWSHVPSPNEDVLFNTLQAVSAVSSDEVWAVGFSFNGKGTPDRTLVLHWNGTAWTVVPSPNVGAGDYDNNYLQGVHAIAPDDAWAVGYYANPTNARAGLPLALHWDGSAWSVASIPSSEDGSRFSDVDGAAANDVWAVGQRNASQGLSMHYTGDCVQPPATATTAPDQQFSDVPPGSTFYSQITCLVDRGVVTGYQDGTFRPGSQITRGQIAKIVSNAAGYSDDVTGMQTYADVPSTQPFHEWIERLSMRGHMSGYPCGGAGAPCDGADRPYFRPGNNASRGQLSKIVSNAAGYADTPEGQTFEDVPSSSPFYLFIERLTVRGVMSGYPCGGAGEPCSGWNMPYFRPSDNVTRGQASKIVSNTFFPNCATSAAPKR